MKKVIVIIFLLLLSYFSVSAFFKPGFFSIHDDTQIARTSEMMNSLQDGMFPVRWVENLGYGYGYPIFNFYAPLPYYVSGIIGILGVNALIATKVAFVLATVFAGIFMYLFVKEFFGKLPAFVAAIVYLYFPYHAVNIFIRGNLNEVFAYAFFPLIFLGFYKLYYSVKENTAAVSKWVVLLGVAIAYVTTSHNLSAYMVALILVLLTVTALIFSPNRVRFFMLIASAGALGIGLSAFYWLPVLLEMKYSDVLSQVGGGADYRDHFVCLSQYWNSPWGFGGSGPGCIDGMSFKLGKLNILLTILSILAFSGLLLIKKKKDHAFLFLSIVGVLLFALFISTEYSRMLWDIIPRIDFLQFPWRFINFTAIAMSVLAGLLVVSAQRFFGTIGALLVCIGIIVGTIVMNAKLFVPQTYYDRSSEYYTNTEFIRWDTSKISDEYMPPGFSVPLSREEVPQEKVVISTGSAEVNNVFTKTGRLEAQIQAEIPSEVLLTIAPFPAWRVYRNGVEIEYLNTNQGIIFEVPEGISTITAEFTQTSVQKIGNSITAVTILGVIGLFVKRRKYGKKTKK